VFNANFVTGRIDKPVVELPANAKTFTALGNITTGAIIANNAALPAPWAPLNIIVA
jgi:hypothetical protein